MEFTKDIYFDDSLKNGKSARITYVGELFKNGSEHVNLVSGFGSNWDFTSTIPMQKTENGFIAEIEMKDFDTFNFCFSNEHNAWDNNNYFNYVSPILPEVQEFNFDFEFDSLEKFMNSLNTEQNAEVDSKIEFGNDYSSSIDDIIEDILGNTVQNSISNDTKTVEDILNSIQQEAMPEIENLFNELFFEDQNNIEQNELENVQDFVVAETADNVELTKLFNELFEDASKPLYFDSENTAEFRASDFNLDGLVSELLEPVISTPVTINNEESLFDNIEENTITEETALVAVEHELQVSSRRLGVFYKFKKRISLACYKLFVKVPKELGKQLGFYRD